MTFPTPFIGQGGEEVPACVVCGTKFGVPGMGTFCLIDTLGHSNFSQVFLAVNDAGKHFAIKLEEVTNESYMEREIAVRQHMKTVLPDEHRQYVSKTVGAIFHECFTGLIMKHYPVTLYSYIYLCGAPSMSLEPCQRTLRQMAEALVELGRHGVVHSDIKPENVVLTKKGNVRLIDFGGAVIPSLEPDAFPLQTPLYRAPEVVLDIRSSFPIDVWSTGAMIAEMYLGRPIFAGQNSVNMMQLMEKRLGRFPTEMIENAHLRMKAHFVDGQVRKAKGIVVDNYWGNTDKVATLDYLILSKRVDCDTDSQRQAFLSVLRGMLEFDPATRLKPEQILEHPFLSMDLVRPPEVEEWTRLRCNGTQ